MIKNLFVVGTIVTAGLAVAFAQSNSPERAAFRKDATKTGYYTVLPIGPGDILSITFSNSPELNTKEQVSASGEIKVPLLVTTLRAAGLTPIELASLIAKSLEDAKQLRDPYVSVFVEEQHSQYATVLGAVNSPGAYPLERETTLLELLSMAGMPPTTGATLTIVHSKPGSCANRPGGDQAAAGADSSKPLRIQLAALTNANDPSSNVKICSGDIINVASASMIYVVGAVGKPGAFTIEDPRSGMTLLEALALASGLQSTASAAHSLLIRRETGRQKQLISVDLGKLMTGKLDDQELKPDDILFVPESHSKKTLQAMARVAEQSVAGIASYGIGYRIAF